MSPEVIKNWHHFRFRFHSVWIQFKCYDGKTGFVNVTAACFIPFFNEFDFLRRENGFIIKWKAE